MNIQIDGVNTQNKGAELMLVSVLDELELRLPGCNVYINPDSIFDYNLLPPYNLNIKHRHGLKFGKFFNYFFRLLNLEHSIRFFKENYSSKKIDVILDASGFKYSDQWPRTIKWIENKEKYYSRAVSNNTKIFFLTQAFGPFKTKTSLKSVSILNKYCNLIYARDDVSYKYLIEAKLDPEKIKKSCDFTLKTKGIILDKFTHLKDFIVIIHNKKMLSHGNNDIDDYIDLFVNIIFFLKNKNENIFLLNHEGIGDHKICEIINSKIPEPIEIVSYSSAKEIKGVIGNSKLTISSRFHGVASSLSQGVPCLATSWNHKYEMLFKSFDQQDCVLNVNDKIEINLNLVYNMYQNIETNKTKLQNRKQIFINQTNLMWDTIFEKMLN